MSFFITTKFDLLRLTPRSKEIVTMKITVPQVSFLIEHSDIPFNYFLYLPCAPAFTSIEEETRWIERAKALMFNRIKENQSLTIGNFHVVHLPEATLDSEEPINVPHDYDIAWCAVVFHPKPASSAFEALLKNIDVPHHQVGVLVPDMHRFLRNPPLPDLVDIALKRFIILIMILLILLLVATIVVTFTQ